MCSRYQQCLVKHCWDVHLQLLLVKAWGTKACLSRLTRLPILVQKLLRGKQAVIDYSILLFMEYNTCLLLTGGYWRDGRGEGQILEMMVIFLHSLWIRKIYYYIVNWNEYIITSGYSLASFLWLGVILAWVGGDILILFMLPYIFFFKDGENMFVYVLRIKTFFIKDFSM